MRFRKRCLILTFVVVVCLFFVISRFFSKYYEPNQDMAYIKGRFNEITLKKKQNGEFELKNTTGWDHVVFCEAYSSYEDIGKILKLNKESMSTLRRNLMSYETGQIYFVKKNSIVEFRPTVRLNIRPDMYLILHQRGSVFYRYTGKLEGEIKLSLKSF